MSRMQTRLASLDVSELMGRNTRDRAIMCAMAWVEGIEQLEAPQFPEAPDDVAYIGGKHLVETMRIRDYGGTLNADKQKLMALLGLWRCEVLKSEGIVASQVASGIISCRTLWQAKHREGVERVRNYLLARHSIKVGPKFPWDVWAFAERKALRLDVMPLYYRDGEEPKGGWGSSAIPRDRYFNE